MKYYNILGYVEYDLYCNSQDYTPRVVLIHFLFQIVYIYVTTPFQ